jgi:hypothetical protein
MKVVNSLARYLQARGLLSDEEFAELRRKGFLERHQSKDWSDYDLDFDDSREIYADDDPAPPAAVERVAAPGKTRRGKKPVRPGGGLPELEIAATGLLPVLDKRIERLKPLAGELGLGAKVSEWPRLFQEIDSLLLAAALRTTLTSGKLKFADLWGIISEDSWQSLQPAERPGGPAWSAWRVLLASPDGRVATGYRWILRHTPVREVFRRMGMQRTLASACAVVFREQPDLLWRAASRPLHDAGFLALSFAYTAAVNRQRDLSHKTELPADLRFSAGSVERDVVTMYGAPGVRWVRRWTRGDPPRCVYGSKGALELQDAESRKVFLHAHDGGEDWIPAFSPCGGFIAATRQNEFRLWTSDGQAVLRRVCSSPQPYAVEYSASGDAVWAIDGHGTCWSFPIHRLETPPESRTPAGELPGRETVMQAWTVARRLETIDATLWLPILALIPATDAAVRLTYRDLGLLAPRV